MLPSNGYRRPCPPRCPQCGTFIRTLWELHSQAASCAACAIRWQRAVEVRREQRHDMEALLSAQRAVLEPCNGLIVNPVIRPESGNLLSNANGRARNPTIAFARFLQCMPPPLVPTIEIYQINGLAMLARSMRTYPRQLTSISTQTTPTPEQGSHRPDNLVDLTFPEETSTGSQTTQNQNTFRDVANGSRTAEEVASAIARCIEPLMPSLPIQNVNHLAILRCLTAVEEDPLNEEIADNQSVVAPTECIQSPEQILMVGRDMSPMPSNTTTAQPQPGSNSSSQSTQDTQASEANKEGSLTTEPKKDFNNDTQT